MAITTFIPELWTARLLYALENAHIATNFVNRDYEGEIKKAGDTVHINTIGDVTVRTYTANTDIADPDALTTTDQTLEINQCKYFNFQVDDVDAAQAAGDVMDVAMKRAAYALDDIADAFLFSTIAAGAATANVVDESATALTAETIYGKIVAVRTLLDKNNVPSEGRCLGIPPEAYALLLQDDRFVKASSPTTADRVLLRGEVGECAGFTVFESNNIKKTTPSGTTTPVFQIVATVPQATTFAEQIVNTEAYRPQKRFADAVKGLHVYGAKVTNGNAVAVLKAKFA